MSDEKRKVLEMLEAGKISQQDAKRLLEALGETGGTEPAPQQENWEQQAGSAGANIEQARKAAEKAREEAEKFREEAERARVQAEIDRVFLPAAEGTREELRGAVEEARQALQEAVERSALQEASEALEKAARQAAEAVGGSAPHLTLHPEREDDLGDVISRTVEDTIEQAQKELGNDWDAIGERINDAVTSKMNSVFGGMPTPPEPPEEPIAHLPADGTPYDYPNLGDKVESLTIDWVSGPVEVRRGQDNALKVTEYANRPLKDGEMLELHVDDGEVTIRFCRERSFWNGFGVLKPTKHLVVELPCSLDHLEELTVKNVSGAVYVDGLEGEDFSISSVSGKVCPSNLRAEDMKLNSVSGGIQAASVAAEDLHITSPSGKVEVTGFSAEDAALTTVSGSVQAMGQSGSVSVKTTSGSAALQLANMPDEVKMNSMSGKLSLTLPDGAKGFTVKYNSKSGFFHSDFPLSGNLGTKSGKAYYTDGEADIGMNTMSGSMELHKA